MRDDCFHFPVPNKGLVIIKPSDRDPSRYAVWLNETLMGDIFGSPEDAAECAFRNDFPTEAAMRFFKINVPWVPRDIGSWNKGLPDYLPEETEESVHPPEQCPPRPWRRTDSRR